MNILFAASEMAPWVKTGGLGDVAAALPAALVKARHDVRVLLPFYPAVRDAFPNAETVADLPAPAPALPPARLLAAQAEGVPLLLLDCPELYDRAGNPYVDANGHDWVDNALRFGLLSRVAALLGQENSPLDWRPDVVHVNDWQTALAPAYLHYEGGAASIVTVHNIAFQGCFAHSYLAALGLPAHAWHFNAVEYHNSLSFLKAGLQLATLISTVSPTYAREIQDEEFGYGLAPLLRHRADAVRGILNGVDTDIWNPATDAALPFPYAANRLSFKRENKAALQAQLGLEVRDDVPLFGVVSRLTHQKGHDLLLTLVDGLRELPAQLAVLGSGEKELESGFRALADAYPGQVAVTLGFDEPLAHRIEAGADIFLMPSRFEPCGLNQMYSLRYGTPPIVRATGGLADTVVDVTPESLAEKTANGFVFHDATPPALWLAMERAAKAWQDKRTWQRIQQNGMRVDFSWKHEAGEYAKLYKDAVAARGYGSFGLTAQSGRKGSRIAAMPKTILIAAVAKNRVIGRDNQLVWHLPEDMQHFKSLTQGHTVLMGRKTWESLPPRFRPLPGRRNIVVTRQGEYVAAGAEVAGSLPAALALAGEEETVFVIGGAEIYNQALPLADGLEITEIDLEPEGDAWFPAIPAADWQETARTAAVSQNGLGYAFVTYQRIRK